MKAETGLVLGGRYRLLELLATGGMGEVWSANDLSVGRTVAVKVLREEYTGNQEFLRRLRTEARNSAALSHPNIAQMYDYGEEAGTGYLVMELVPGESLADMLDRQPILPANLLIPILADTARGLQHAHHNSVIHRDVKPGNILLQEVLPGTHPKVKITDFGVSLAANQAPMTATGMVMGTAQYLSPEQAVGNPATARSDLYALGIIAYEASVGKRPFSGKSPVDIAIAHVNDPVPPLPRKVDPQLAQIIMRLLAKDPDQRPESAAVLAAELDALISPPPRKYSHVYSTPVPVVTPAHLAAVNSGGAVDTSPESAAPATPAAPEQPRYPSRVARRSALPSPNSAAAAPPALAGVLGAPGASAPAATPAEPTPVDRKSFLPASSGGGSAPTLDAPPPIPIRSSVRRPVSPVAAYASSDSAGHSAQATSAGSAPVRPRRQPTALRLSGATPAHSAARPQPSFPRTPVAANHSNVESNLPKAELPDSQPAPDNFDPYAPKPPSRLLIGAIVVGLIVVLYLIVRYFADDAAGVGGQMSVIQGTIGLAGYGGRNKMKLRSDFQKTVQTKIGRHLGG